MGNGLTYTATLSNGAALPSGLSFGGMSLVIGTLAAGSYAITVTATDEGSASSTFTLTINNVAPVFTSSPSNQTLARGQAMTAYTAPAAGDLNGDALTYSASNLPPGIAFNASTHTFSGTPTTAGTWTVTYKAVDPHGASVSKTFTITVAIPVGPAPTYNGGIPSTVNLDFDPSTNNTYTFPASAFSSSSGYALTYTATGNGVTLPTDGVSLNSATRTFTANYRRPNSSLSIVLTATDTHGQHVSHTFTINITGGVGTDAVGGRNCP